MIPDVPFSVGGTAGYKGGSKHHVNDVNARDLKLNTRA